MKATAAIERALIFRWDRVRRIPLILPGFIFLSFLGHIGIFFLFRVVYPAQASLPMPPPTVTVLDPTRPDHQALLRWAEAEDTAPAATQNPVTDRLLKITYQPSYATVRTAPLTLPPEVNRHQYPPPIDPLTLIRSVEARPSAPVQTAPTAPTRVVFGGALAGRSMESGTLAFTARSAEALEPAEFLVGVTDRGEVRFVILQRSSGQEALDAEAARQLSAVKLAKADAPVTWGTATIFWGADAYRLPAK